MKIIHCGDIHLDSSLQSYFSIKKAQIRNQELLDTFQRMVEYAKDNNVEAIMIAGDLFDTSFVSSYTFQSINQLILDNPNIVFFYLQGNHDKNAFVDRLEVIPDNLKLFNQQWTSYYLGDSICITGKEVCDEDLGHIEEPLVLDEANTNIVLLHGIYRDTMLRHKGIDYLALGHYHQYKAGNIDTRGKYSYCGCLEGRGYDELGEHGFVLLDIQHHVINSVFVPFASRNIHSIQIDVSECFSQYELKSKIDKAIEHVSRKDAIKVELMGEIDPEASLKPSVLPGLYQEKYFDFRLENKTTYAYSIDHLRNEPSLKGEFVRTVLDNTHYDNQQQLKMIHYVLQALQGEEIE